MATDTKGKALGLTKANTDVVPMLSDIGGDTWVSTSGVTAKAHGASEGVVMELRVAYDFKGCSPEQIKVIACRALDIDMQRRVRDAFKTEDVEKKAEKVKAITGMCSQAIKVSEISKGDRARLSPADKIRKMFPNLTDDAIEKMMKAGSL